MGFYPSIGDASASWKRNGGRGKVFYGGRGVSEEDRREGGSCQGGVWCKQPW